LEGSLRATTSDLATGFEIGVRSIAIEEASPAVAVGSAA
jgi:hypothetical protein